ncbi:hypothetical protein [Flavobacterium columnare]|uniref:hypothetical protein n=1 Tax=Flavobacterium columnare TaxID=996 RepID=UPI001BC87E21|nr:hypothetical protein [Flavobacterium columnare]AUX17160.1 hypothetical protein AQ623_01680 [Flavobacterium columnare]
MAGIDGYKKVFNDTSAFIKNINFDLISRYAAAFGMMAAGNAIESVFIKKTENEDYSFETFPLQQSDVEYVKMVVPDLEPLEFSAILYGDKGSLFAPPLLIGLSRKIIDRNRSKRRRSDSY